MALDLDPLSPNYGKPLASSDDALDQQIMQRELQGREQLRRAAALSTADRAPDRTAEVLNLSRQLQRPPGDIEAEIARSREAARASNIDWNSIPERARRLAEADATAPIVRDDLDQLSGLSRAIEMLGFGFRQGRDIVNRSLLREKAARGTLTPAEQAELARLRQRGREISNTQDFANEWINVAANAAGTMYETFVKAGPTGAAAGTAAAVATAVAGQAGPQALVPEEIATVPAAFSLGFMTKAFEVSARQQRGEALENMDELERRQGRRLDPDVKDLTATLHGIVGGALDTVSLGVATGPIRRVIEEAGKRALVRPTVQQALLRFGQAYVETVGSEVATETLQEASSIMFESIAKEYSAGNWTDDPQQAEDRIANTIVETTKAMLLLGPFVPAGGLAMDMRAVQRANDRVQSFREFAQWVEAVKLRERSPEEFRATVNEEGAKAGIEDVYISASAFRTYFQSQGMDPEVVAQELGVSEQLQDIGDLDRDLVIPLGTFAERVVPTEHYAELVNDVRFSPMDMSAREAKDQKDTIAAYQQQAEEELKVIEERHAVADAEAQQVFDEVVQAQVAAGTAQKTAEKNAALYRAFFRTRALRRGTSVLGEWRAWSFGVERPGLTPEGAPERGFRQDGEPITVPLAGREIPITQDQWSARAGDQLVNVDTAAFDAGFQRDAGFYVGPQGQGGIAGRYERFAGFSQTAQSIEAPTVTVTRDGTVRFGNGRHRYAYMRDQGLQQVPVSMDAESLQNAIDNGIVSPEAARTFQQQPIDETLPGSTGNMSERQAFEEIYRYAGLLGARKLANSKRWQNRIEFKRALQAQVQEAARDLGIELRGDSEQAFRYAVFAMEADARQALSESTDAVGWYDRKVRAALHVLALLHPEVLTDEKARFAFTWALAVTSNGLKVDKNFELAVKAYEGFKKTGRMPTDVGVGNAADAINEALTRYNEMVADWGLDTAMKFMVSEFKVSELADVGYEVSGESAETVVRGAAVLGPKIGNGFFSNLYGFFSALTMDRWYMRTVGRLQGELVYDRPDMVQSSTEKLVRAIEAASSIPGVLQDFERVTGATFGIGDAHAQAVAIQKASIDPETRAVMNRTPQGEELRRAGNTLAKWLAPERDSPEGGGERMYLRTVMSEVLARLQQDFPAITMADLQAVVWYPEKLLADGATSSEDVQTSYTPAGEDEDGGTPDYQEAAVMIARAKGISQRRIDNALKRSEEEHGRATGTRREGAGDEAEGDSVDALAVGRRGFDAPERSEFLAWASLRAIRRSDPERLLYGSRSGNGAGAEPAVGKRRGKPKPKAYWKLGKKGINALTRVGVDVREIQEWGPEKVEDFIAAMERLKDGNKFAASVYIYPAEELRKMRIFMTDDNEAGFALKPDGDIVSVFNTRAGPKGWALQALVLATQLGGRKLDCFDTVLPKLYAQAGFRVAARIPWSEAQKPDAWNKETFGKFNGGEPDVAFMVYDPEQAMIYRPGDGKYAPGTNDDERYGAAVRMQAQAAGKAAAAHVRANAARQQAREAEAKRKADEKLAKQQRQGAPPAGTTLQQSQIDTPEFRQFFGDSKVVDKTGAPLVVYRGMMDPIRNDRFSVRGFGTYGPGIYLSADPSVAGFWAGDMAADGFEQEYGGAVYPVYVRIENPASGDIASEMEAEHGENAMAEMQKLGYDGVITSDGEIVAFSPEQVKSAVSNDGRFSRTDANILRQDDGKAPRGEIAFSDTGAVIRLFAAADLSTFLHESGHLFLEIMRRTDDLQEEQAAILSWLGLDSMDQIETVHHERFARAFEAYLHEGRAPSAGLAAAFRAFRDWLVEIYGMVTRKTLDVELSPTIREVFDRMLATDEEIAAQAQAHSIVPVLDALTGLGLTEREANGYREKVAKAASEAREKLLAKALRQVRRERTAAYREREKALREEATARVSEMRVYRAQHYLMTGTLLGSDEPPPVRVQLSRKGVEDMVGKKTAGRFGRFTVAEGGVGPDTIAPLLGYRDGGEMLDEFEGSPTMKQAIDMIVKRGLQAEFGDMLHDGTLEREALESLQTSEAQIELLAEEVRILRRMGVEAGVKDAATEQARKAGPRDAGADDQQIEDTNAGVIDALIAGGVDQARGPAIANMAAGAAADENARGRADVRRAKSASAEATRFTKPELDAMRSAAEDAAGRRKVRAAGSMATWMGEEARAFRALKAALAARRWDEAAMAARQRLFSRLLTAAGVKAKREVTTGIAYLRRMAKVTEAKSIDIEYLDQIHALLERFNLKQVSKRKQAVLQNLNDFLAREEAEGRETAVPDALRNEANRISYQEMTVEEFRGLVEAVKNIEHLGRLKNKLLDKRRREQFEQVKGRILDTILSKNKLLRESQNISPDMRERLRNSVNRLHAEHTKLEFLFQALDGEQELGPVWDAFFRPFVDAENEELRRGAELQAKLKKIFEKVPAEQRAKWHTERTYVKALGMNFTRAELISLGLNWGNEGNRAALMNGQLQDQTWSEAQINAALAEVTDAEWDVIQEVWDLIDTLWPDIVDLYRDVAGITPGKVEALPFVTPTGKAMRGGYYPLKYDPRRSHRALQIEEKNSAKDLLSNNFVKATTKDGHTKARVENVKLKVRLDLSVASQHLQDVLHDLTHRRALLDVNKLATDPDIRAAITNTQGSEMYQLIRPWLQSIAAGTPPPSNSMEKLWARARAGASVVNMGWKISTAIVQPIGYTQTIDAIGEKWAMRGLSRFYASGDISKQVDFIFERSEQMRNRMKTFDRDVADTLRRLTSESKLDKVRETFFWLTGMADLGTALPSWLGAYGKAMEEFNGNEEKAVQYADMIVRTTQSSGSVKDLAEIQRGSELQKLFTAFYSYFNVLYNLFSKRGRQLRDTRNVPRFLASMMYLWWVPAVLSEMIAGRAPDDEDDWLKWALKKELAYPLQSVVLLRDIVQAATTDFDYEVTPAAEMFKAISDTIENLAEGDGLSRSEIKKAAAAVGYTFALPTRQVTITSEAFYRWLVEGDDVPLSDFFLSPQRKAKQ